MQTVSILCRSCGAPSDGVSAGDVPCRYCGSRTPIDMPTRHRLVAHQARMQRALEKARCVVRGQIFAALLPSIRQRVQLFIFGGLLCVLLVAPVFLLGGASAVMMSEDVDDGSVALIVVGVAAMGIGLLAGVGGFPLGLFMAFRLGMRADASVSRTARSVENFVEAVVPTRCVECGGHAQVVMIGLRAAAPCPWCGASLASASSDAAKAATSAVIAAQQKISDDLLRRARTREELTARNKFGLKIPGFELRGGVHEGLVHGVPVWIALEVKDIGTHRRTEVERDTRLTGTIWFVRREGAHGHAQLLQSESLPSLPPAATDPEVDVRFVVFSDGVDAAAVACSPWVRHLLWSLGPQESLRLDPAGGSLWRLSDEIAVSNVEEFTHCADRMVRAVWELG